MNDSPDNGGSGCGFLVVFLVVAILLGGWLFRTLHIDTLFESPSKMGVAGFPVAVLLGILPWAGIGGGLIMLVIALTSNKDNPALRIAIAVGGFALFSIGLAVVFRALF